MRALMAGAAVGTLLALGVASGCGGSDPPASHLVFCDAVCSRAIACSASRVVNRNCFEDCASGEAELAHIREDAIGIVAACIGQLDCVTIFEGPYDACWARAEAQTPPAAYTREFCFAFSTALWECGWTYPVEDCESGWGLWDQALLDRVLACKDQPSCPAFDACIAAEIDD